MIHVVCGYCSKRFRLDPKHAGKQIKCPSCSEPIFIPDPTPETVAAHAALDSAFVPVAQAPEPGPSGPPFDTREPEPDRPPLMQHIKADFAGAWKGYRGPKEPVVLSEPVALARVIDLLELIYGKLWWIHLVVMVPVYFAAVVVFFWILAVMFYLPFH